MKPFCFVLMPFGSKPDDQGRIIDFDAIYQEIIAPAVDKANLDGIRADEEHVGGAIHKPMFERLMLCEYAIADLTIANPNVYYELGIRHAMRPRSTVLLNASGTRLPFDLAIARATPYELGTDGRPTNAAEAAARITEQLVKLGEITTADSPIFQLVDGLKPVDIAHLSTDVFRERALYSTDIKNRLKAARDLKGQAGRDALDKMIATDVDLRHLATVDAGIVVDLLISYRAVDGYQQMVDVYERAAPELKHVTIMQEQYAFALNRLKQGDKAEAILKELIEKRGASSETNGILGRVYKDRYEQALETKSIRANGELSRAIDAYAAGFEADWRDAYPGINAVSLMEMQDKPDPRQKDMLPVVRYSALRRARLPGADYWDHATMLELAVLANDVEEASNWLSSAVATERDEAWKFESTKKNLGLIRRRRISRGEDAEWIAEVENELQDAADRLKSGG